MNDLKIEIENLETFLNNSNFPTNENSWYCFCQDISSILDNVKNEFEYYDNEMNEKIKDVETLKDKINDIKYIVS